jgi:putative membrane protein
MLVRWLINAAALVIIAYILPQFHAPPSAAIVAAVFLGIINAVIRPVVMFLTLPLNILTLGLFTFVVNATMLWLVDVVVKGFETGGPLTTLLGALLLSIISSVLSSLVGNGDRE